MNRHKDDWYPTPPEATRKLLEVERFDGVIWEPAAGDGALCEVLREAGHSIIASDLNDYGYCKSGVDFLMETKTLILMVHKAVEIDLGVRHHAWLLRLSFLEGVGRHERLFAKNPPARVHVFSHRLTMWRGDEDARPVSGTMAFAWFVWDKALGSLKLKPRINWIV